MEAEGGALHVEHVCAQHVARHEVGCELHAPEVGPDEARREPCQQRLGHAGYAFDEHMAACKDAGEHQVDRLLLPHDDAGNLSAQLFYFLCEGGDLCQRC